MDQVLLFVARSLRACRRAVGRHAIGRVTVISVAVLLLALGGVVSAQCPPCPLEGACPTQPTTCVPPRPVVGGVFTNPEWLRIDYHRVTAEINSLIATTNIDMQFTNGGNALAEGTFLFPLPQGATVDNLVMFVNGQAIDAQILTADEARNIYDEIVRQYRDPALLEYVGTGAIQANVFPIPPNESRRIQLSYTQALAVNNGLVKYVYPLSDTARSVATMSISVNVVGSDAISNVYSPSYTVAISRGDDGKSFRAGFESTNFTPNNGDFTLFYGIANDTISLNLLTYRESATDDGFFLLMVQPPITVDTAAIQPKDVIIVLDQSGSMEGVKWQQAQAAVTYVLSQLNAQDRFNVILFSTGWRTYAPSLAAQSQAADAAAWVNNQMPEGGTNMNEALTQALAQATDDRPTTILFMTDGLATEGIMETADILDNLQSASKPNVRIFPFGVGDDVNTILLDSIARDFRGTGGYVRPTERVDEEVAALYNRISAPVLSNITLTFSGGRTELQYPQTLPDLFAGTQLTLVGRYRDGVENLSITLNGTVNGVQETYTYDALALRTNAGGEDFIARLWATRRIGELQTQIRLNGENPELIQSIVNLSIRYGIITPYTSFLITEDDILTQSGRDNAVARAAEEAQELNAQVSGAVAVDAADSAGSFAAANAPAPVMSMPTTTPLGTMTAGGTGGGVSGGEPNAAPNDAPYNTPLQVVGDKTFLWQEGVWTDTAYIADDMTTQDVVFLSDEYFALLEQFPDLRRYFALGSKVIVLYNGVVYQSIEG
jgi:Ca-activated chloride channel homolog